MAIWGGRRRARARSTLGLQPVDSLQLISVPVRRATSLSIGSYSSDDEPTPVQANEAGPSSPPESGSSSEAQTRPSSPRPASAPSTPLDSKYKTCTCGICGELITVLAIRPYRLEPRAPPETGLMLPCYNGHNYCYDCISTYIKTKLEDAGVKSVFPIKCPECQWWINDNTAREVLTKSELEGLWFWGKVFDEVPTFYCPVGSCGARIELPQQECARDLRKTQCPACQEEVCFKCQVKWHQGQSCAKYARLSGSVDRDRALQKLAKKFKWRRCPKCRIVVERNMGCRHITCRCGHQFCYRCGRIWGEGCGRRRSKVCFPLKVEIWPETRSRVVEIVRDWFSWGSGRQ